jgi:hypothetical protein
MCHDGAALADTVGMTIAAIMHDVAKALLMKRRFFAFVNVCCLLLI